MVPGGPKLDPPTTAEGETVETHGKITGSGDSRVVSTISQSPFGPETISVTHDLVVSNEFSRITMRGLARFLTIYSDLPVFDRTGIAASWSLRSIRRRTISP